MRGSLKAPLKRALADRPRFSTCVSRWHRPVQSHSFRLKYLETFESGDAVENAEVKAQAAKALVATVKTPANMMSAENGPCLALAALPPRFAPRRRGAGRGSSQAGTFAARNAPLLRPSSSSSSSRHLVVCAGRILELLAVRQLAADPKFKQLFELMRIFVEEKLPVRAVPTPFYPSSHSSPSRHTPARPLVRSPATPPVRGPDIPDS